MLKLSLIIPVYNEERHIVACLDGIASQTHKPYEVIVVDNNCTDATLEIAKKYDFVKIVHEKKQGLIHARNLGFETAKGDILGRIDADSQINNDWVLKVIEYFESDTELGGLTGLAYTPMFPILQSPKFTFYNRAYYWNVRSFFGVAIMWGATMSIRRSSWEKIKKEICLDNKRVHEDQDISLCMAAKSQKVFQANDVRVISYNQSFRYLPKLIYYIRLRNKTKTRHKELGNLPAPQEFGISNKSRVISYLFSLPVLLYGLLMGLIFLPIDWYMTEIKRDKNWFD